MGFESQSKNRGRAEKSRMKKEARTINVEPNWEGLYRFMMHMKTTDKSAFSRVTNKMGPEWKKIVAMAEKNKWTESVNEVKKGEAELFKGKTGWMLNINNGKSTFTYDLGGKDRKFRGKGNNLKTTEKQAKEFAKKILKHPDFKGQVKLRESVNELVPPMSVSNPAAYKAMLDKQIAKNVKVKTALGNKKHKDHKKAKSLYQRFMDKFKKKKGDKPKKAAPKKQSKSDADFYKRQFTGESTTSWQKSLKNAMELDKKNMLSKKDKATLQKIAKLMKNANIEEGFADKLTKRLKKHKGTSVKKTKIKLKGRGVYQKYDEGFGGQLKGSDKKKFEKARKENAEQLGYTLTGTSDVKIQVNESEEFGKAYTSKFMGQYGKGKKKKAVKLKGKWKHNKLPWMQGPGKKNETKKKKKDAHSDIYAQDTWKKKKPKKFKKNYPSHLADMGESHHWSIEPSGVMAKINKIVQDKQAMKIGGVLVDMFSAGIMMQIYDKVNDKNKEQMNKGNIRQVQVVLNKVMKHNKITK